MLSYSNLYVELRLNKDEIERLRSWKSKASCLLQFTFTKSVSMSQSQKTLQKHYFTGFFYLFEAFESWSRLRLLVLPSFGSFAVFDLLTKGGDL